MYPEGIYIKHSVTLMIQSRAKSHKKRSFWIKSVDIACMFLRRKFVDLNIITLCLILTPSLLGLELSLLKELYKSPVESPEWLQYSKKYAATTSMPLQDQWLFNVRRNKLLSDDPFEVFREQFFDQSQYKMRYNSISKPRRDYIRNYYKAGFYAKAIHHLQKEEAEQPNNLYVLMNMAHVYEHLQQYDLALERISKVLEKSIERSTRIESYKWRVRLLRKLNNFNAAEQDLLRLRELAEQKVDAIKGHVNALKDPKKKIKAEFQLFSARQELAEIKNFLGINWYFQNKLVLAFDIFESLEAEFPGCYSFSFNKNKIYLEKRRYESTLKSINSILGNTRALALYYKRLTLRSINSGDLDLAQLMTESREYFESLVSRLLTRKGEILFREKHYSKALETFKLALERNPSDSISWYRTGLIYIEQRRYNNALVSFRKVLQNTLKQSTMHKNSIEWIDKVFSEQAVQAIKTQDYQSKKQDEFLQNLDVKQRQEFKDLSSLIKIGYEWLREGKQLKLIKFYEPLLKDYPNVMEIYYLLGKAYQGLGNVNRAKSYYRRSLSIDDKHLPTLVSLVYFHCVSREFDEAIAKIETLESLYPDDHRVMGARGWYEYQLGNLIEAIDSFHLAIQKNPLHADHHYRLGMSYLKSGLPRFALHKFDDALSAGYEFGRTHLFRAIAMLKLGDFQSGENALKKASTKGGDNSDITSFARYLLSKVKKGWQITLTGDEVPEELKEIVVYLGRLESKREMKVSLSEIRQGKVDTTINRLQARINKDTSNLELNHMLSIVYMLIQRDDLAREILEDAIAKNSMHYPSLQSIAELAFRQGRIDQCVIYWERLKHVSPLINYAPYIKSLIPQMNKYLEINSRDYWALYHLVLIHVHTNREEDALNILEKYNILSSPIKDQYLIEIQKLHGMILYKKGVLDQNQSLINQARGILSESGYRYLDSLEIYKIGTAALRPSEEEKWTKIPVSESSLDFLRTDESRRSIQDIKEVSHPGVRKKATFVGRWNQLEETLKRGNTAAVKSSYDRFIDKRVSQEERFLEDNRERAKRLTENSRELQIVNVQKATVKFQDALDSIAQGKFQRAESDLLDAISARVDFEEAYFGLLTLYLVQGEYLKMQPFMQLLEAFENSLQLLSLIRFHIYFHQGNFAMAKSQINNLSQPLRIPRNRIVNELIDIYSQVITKAPGDLQASLRYGLLLQVTGQFNQAEKIFKQVASNRGMIPYICESLTVRGILERRFTPMREAVKKMSDFSALESKEKWLKLAKDLDSYLVGSRFLAQ